MPGSLIRRKLMLQTESNLNNKMERNSIIHISDLIRFPAKNKFLANRTETEIADLTLKLAEKESIKSFEQTKQHPQSNTQKYFYWYINIHTSKYKEDVIKKIDGTKNDLEKYYIVNYELGMVLNPLLRELGKKLESNRHQFFYLPRSRRRDYFENNVFIGILLKEVLTSTYISIQTKYEKFVLQDYYSLCDLGKKYFDSHTRLSYAYEHEECCYQIKNPKKKPENLGLFKACYKDIHPIPKSQPNYEDLIINKHKFGEIELQMYKNGLINAEYSFVPCKAESHHTLMAVLYHEMINKGIFKTHFIRLNRGFSPTDYRKYLDDRYSIDTNQQFRRMTKEMRDFAIEKLPWITQISHSF